jgi:uncharacterized membrane protein
MGLLRCVVVTISLALLASCSGREEKYPVLQPQGEAVVVDVRSIASGAGRFFSYHSPSGRKADFLVYRESNGTPRACLAACRECYRWKKGYRLEGDGVKCIKCDLHFRFDTLKEGLGSCVPIPLPATPEGERLKIPVAALEEGTRYF